MGRQNGWAEAEGAEAFVRGGRGQNSRGTAGGAIVHDFDEFVLVQVRAEGGGNRIENHGVSAEIGDNIHTPNTGGRVGPEDLVEHAIGPFLNAAGGGRDGAGPAAAIGDVDRVAIGTDG